MKNTSMNSSVWYCQELAKRLEAEKMDQSRLFALMRHAWDD
ncbi:hypothetical protein [Haliscomenobacter sp.]